MYNIVILKAIYRCEYAYNFENYFFINYKIQKKILINKSKKIEKVINYNAFIVFSITDMKIRNPYNLECRFNG